LRYALALIACLTPASLHAQEVDETPSLHDGDRHCVEFSTGIDFEGGKFGTTSRIEKVAVPLTARASVGRLRVSAQLPWVRVTAPQNVIAPKGPLGLAILVDPSRPAGVSTRQGVGDLRLNLAYARPTNGVAASIRAGVKLPTASVGTNLGTGEADYEAGLDLSTRAGVLVPFASVTYFHRGDPAGLELKNGVAAQAGAALRLKRSTSAHVGYSYVAGATDASQDDQRIFGGFSTAVGSGVSLGADGSGGLSAGAAELGAGVTLSLNLD
jgi:hypothetical protein